MNALAAKLREVAATLTTEANRLELPAAASGGGAQQIHGVGQNIYEDGHAPQGPWDPAWPGYESGDAAQIMDRKFARQDGHADSNFYVKAKFAKGTGKPPRWSDEKQAWEPD